MISRRALFGIGAGAAATVAMPAQPKPTLDAASYFTTMDIGVDFGTTPAAILFHRCRPGCAHTQKWLREREERVARAMYNDRFREVKGEEEVPPDFDVSPYRDHYLSQARAAIITEPPA